MADTSASVYTLKAKICLELSPTFAPPLLTLQTYENATPLPDAARLADCDIADGAVLEVCYNVRTPGHPALPGHVCAPHPVPTCAAS